MDGWAVADVDDIDVCTGRNGAIGVFIWDTESVMNAGVHAVANVTLGGPSGVVGEDVV